MMRDPRRTRRVAVLTAAALILLVPAMVLAKGASTASSTSAAKSDDADFRASWKLAPGQTIEVKGVNGTIEATAASGNEVEVTAVKSAERSDPNDVKIEVIASSEGVTVCAVYPAPPGKQNSCERGENWSSHTNNNDVQVRFTVRVPRGVKFEARNVNGEVRASGLTAPATLETVNGGVQLETTSYGSASTVNGSVMARIGSAQWPGSLEFKSVNGSIDVTLPAGTGARVEGSTMNGQIETDFPITVRGKVNGRSLEGTIGNGKSEISLESLNGSVRLHSAS